MKPNILIVHNYYQIPGGEDTVVENEKKLLENNGHKVWLYARNNSELKTMGILKKLLLPFAIIYNPKSAHDIRKIIKEKKIDIVHVHNTLALISPAVYYVAKSCKIPVVQTVHNFRFICPGATFYRDGHICEDCVQNGLVCAVKHGCYRNSRVQTLMCVIATKIHRMTGIYGKIYYICLTEFNRNKLLKLQQIKPEKVFVKPNFVEKIERAEMSRKKKEQFIFAGRLDKLKGIDILLKTWEKMGIIAPKLLVCGTGPMYEWCQKFVRNNSCNIEIKGYVSNKKVRALIANSKALILPTQWYEGFPMNIVEAYSVGTPVICTNIGNAGSLVINGITGYRFDGENELIEAIRKVNNRDISEKVLDVYEKLYTPTSNYRKLECIYRNILLMYNSEEMK